MTSPADLPVELRKELAAKVQFIKDYSAVGLSMTVRHNIMAALEETYRLAVVHERERCVQLIEAERLEDPQAGTSDDAYEQAITDCASALRRGDEEVNNESKAENHGPNLRTDLARLLDALYGLHCRPGHLDQVLEVVNLHNLHNLHAPVSPMTIPASALMEQLIDFNLNDYVYVRITPRGFDMLSARDAEFNAKFGAITLTGSSRRSAEQVGQGHTRWQLWDLISTFGAGIYLGCVPPFETTIQLESTALRSAHEEIARLTEKMEVRDEANVELHKRWTDAEAEVVRLRQALESIAKNSCCAPCREAGLFARAALSGGAKVGESLGLSGNMLVVPEGD